MRFHGLPYEMDVGGTDLTLMGPCRLLNSCTCACCGRAGPNFAICVNDHVLCSSCIVSGSQTDHLTAWCPPCKSVVGVHAASVGLEMFEWLSVQCECGVVGSLRTIRQHLLEDGGPHGTRKSQPSIAGPDIEKWKASTKQLDLGMRMQHLEAAADDAERVTSQIIQRCREEYPETDLLQLIGQLVKAGTLPATGRQQRQEAIVQESSTKPSHGRSKKKVDPVQGEEIELDAVYFRFDIAKLNKEIVGKRISVHSHEQFGKIAGYAFAICIRLFVLCGTRFLVIKAKPKSPMPIAATPMKRQHICVKIHAANGQVVHRGPWTINDGQTDNITTMNAIELASKNCLIEGRLLVSVNAEFVENC